MSEPDPLPKLYTCLACGATTRASLYDRTPFCSACGSRALQAKPEPRSSKRARVRRGKIWKHYTDDE